ncbi:MAG: YeeE/YedE thiosulfate transporter family protein [Phaeovulum sp.]|uniref:YeeE/YedE family protein n=1 Tax=Phaeovulum sp. TaxID=2934796 RepID=UPI00273076EF|nr:YeeE/YedE thiosulfate transporter family protein [Phaeovulum sp.]MDP2062618.1 YeeE/YedE thiosulfate transporter family protein [Phaeovulum sp.]
MQADWWWGLAGGLMIGTAAGLYLLLHGRILGASGIIGGLIDGSGRDNAQERLWFLAGLVVVPLLLVPLYHRVETHASSSLPLLAVAGLLVGIGTRLANGCTSGHGVCGISRFSLRGIVATAFYLLGGGLALVIGRHLLGVI